MRIAHLQADDTGALHDGKNGYCTFIGGALDYMARHKLPKSVLGLLEEGRSFEKKDARDTYLAE